MGFLNADVSLNGKPFYGALFNLAGAAGKNVPILERLYISPFFGAVIDGSLIDGAKLDRVRQLELLC